MSKIFTIAVNTFKESIRDRILLSLVLMGFLLIAFSRIFVPISIGQAHKIIKDFGIGMVEIFGLFIVIFIGTRILYQEFERKTIYSVITKPVKEIEFISGKFLGLYCLIIVVQFLLFAIFLIFMKLYLGYVDWYFLNGLYFFIFEFLLLDAIVVFLSCLTSPVITGIITLIFYFIGQSTYYLRELILMMDLDNLTGLANFLYFFFPNFSVFNVKSELVYHLPIHFSSYLLAFSYSLLYSVILIIISSFLFSGREYL